MDLLCIFLNTFQVRAIAQVKTEQAADCVGAQWGIIFCPRGQEG